MAFVFKLFLESNDFRFEVLQEFFDFGLPRIRGRKEQVVLLIGIIDEIEELISIPVPKIDEFVGLCADAVMGDRVVMSGTVVIAIVERFPPVLRGFTF